MFSRKIRRSIRTRLISRVVLFLTISLIAVSAIIYFLLATSLRKSDQNLILNLGQTYRELYREGGSALLTHRVSPEILLIIREEKGQSFFEHWPTHIDHDYEDEDEIEQIRSAVKSVTMKEGWTNVLLLSGEEDKDFLEKLEYQLRLLANEKNWETILPIIDNDLFELHISKIDENKWMIVGKSSEEREEHLSAIRSISFMVIVPFLVTGLILTFFLAENILRPIKKLAQTIHNIRQNGSSDRAELRGSDDEIDLLAQEFNFLQDKNQTLVRNLRETVDNVAHDLRTPLTRIRTSAEIGLLKANDQEALRTALEESLESSELLLNLLNAIMDVAEAESGALPLRREVLSVDVLLSSVLDLYFHVAEEKKINLSYLAEEELFVNVDRQRMLQALGNIIDNALKFSASGTEVKITSEAMGDVVRISIRDEGCGISEDEQTKIWTRLYRGDSSRSTAGLGIGLSLVKAIVEAHDGQIDLMSSKEKGSTFIITLPRRNVVVIER